MFILGSDTASKTPELGNSLHSLHNSEQKNKEERKGAPRWVLPFSLSHPHIHTYTYTYHLTTRSTPIQIQISLSLARVLS